MEKKSITGKDILRMDGLLPPTRRVPICDAITGTPDKKKDKKWSFGGILKRISAIRDYDSSSNEEEMVYCKREPCSRAVPLKKASDIVLRPVRKNLEQYSTKSNATVENPPAQATNSNSICRDSIHSRSSDGSLDGVGRKIRKNKLKARAEAKRDRIRGDESSSDDELHISCNSLTRVSHEDSAQSGHKSGSFNRKSRAARTERYIKRLSKDEGHGTLENLSEIANKRNSLDYMNNRERTASADGGDLFRPPIHPRRFLTQPNSYTFPTQRSSAENLRENTIGLPDAHVRSSVDLTKHSPNVYMTDCNQNNHYAKPAKIFKKDKRCVNYGIGNSSFNPLGSPNQVQNRNYANDYATGYQSVNRSACPPEPPPRDPRRLITYNSFPINGRHQRTTKFGDVIDSGTNGDETHYSMVSEPYRSNSATNWYGSLEKRPRRPASLTEGTSQFYYLGECSNNKFSSSKDTDDVTLGGNEAIKCQIRNSRNDQLSSNFKNYGLPSCNSKLLMNSGSNIHEDSLFPQYENSFSVPNNARDISRITSPTNRTSRDCSRNTQSENDNSIKKTKQEDSQKTDTDEESQQRRRSSKNLEEALSELEAIYNSLRLGDEDLLDRAERRSMEEFSLKQGKNEDIPALLHPDSPDRSKDDMAYRRMHPKERPTSLSDTVGQTALSNISYLMASPVLSRKDLSDNYLGNANYPSRSDEPDITRDDVVYRSISHANNTLKVADPQPPFGIPLGPVTTATVSDYLHTTPTKLDHPRSPYIPKCEPDVVTDDLAFRTLRKDSNTGKNVVESKSSIDGKDSESGLGTKKKRAVRSQSANLYGLINHDRIHLRRESDLQEITDVFSENKVNYYPSSEQKEGFRRVMSDGELSDYDTRWRIDNPIKKSTDINGNHSKSGVQRRKLRVYVSPFTKEQLSDTESGRVSEVMEPSPSETLLSSNVLNDEIWQDYMQSESNSSVSANKDAESDFSAYTRLCQDLVNLIKGPDDVMAELIESENASASILKPTVQINDPEGKTKDDEPSILHIQSLGRHYPGPNDASHEQQDVNGEEIQKLTESILNSGKEDSTNAEDNSLDFYLRLADENVKLIAEAFSNVADHVRDSRLSQKNLTPRRSETENDSTTHDTSTRSSLVCSHDDASNLTSSLSEPTDHAESVPKESISMVIKDQESTSNSGTTTDVELDLSRAVHDLQIAAASLCEHEKEIDELERRMRKDDINDNDDPNNSSLSTQSSSSEFDKQEEKERDQEETEVLPEFEVQASRTEEEPVEEAIGEEVTTTEEINALDKGESNECEFLCKSYNSGIAESSGMNASHVTNLITVLLTTYSMVFLACLLALLLATVAAS